MAFNLKKITNKQWLFAVVVLVLIIYMKGDWIDLDVKCETYEDCEDLETYYETNGDVVLADVKCIEQSCHYKSTSFIGAAACPEGDVSCKLKEGLKPVWEWMLDNVLLSLGIILGLVFFAYSFDLFKIKKKRGGEE